MKIEGNEKGITLAVETLENKDVLFNKLGIFFLLSTLVTLFLYEDLEDEKFIEARAMTAEMPFGFHNKHC